MYQYQYLIAFGLIVINLTSFIVVAVDKYRAKHRKWRVPEKTLFLLGIIGGSIGVYLGFLVFRHKTKHLKFMLGIPLILILQILAVYFAVTHIG